MEKTQNELRNKLALTPTQAGQLLGISRSLVYKLITDGTIPSLRLGEKRILVPMSGLEMMLDGTFRHEENRKSLVSREQ